MFRTHPRRATGAPTQSPSLSLRRHTLRKLAHTSLATVRGGEIPTVRNAPGLPQLELAVDEYPGCNG